MTLRLHFFTNIFSRFSILSFLPPPRKSESYGDFCISYEEAQNNLQVYKPIKLNL